MSGARGGAAGADGRRETFERLLDEHGAAVRRVCRAILGDEHLGADAAQDAFVRLWRQLDGRGRIDHAAAWMRRAAVSAALDLLRRRTAREALVHRVLAVRSDRDVAESVGPGELARAAELRAALAAAVAELPEGQRTVFLLRHEGGLPLREVASCVGLALPTVKTQFARACWKLQARLRPFAPEGEGDGCGAPRAAPAAPPVHHPQSDRTETTP